MVLKALGKEEGTVCCTASSRKPWWVIPSWLCGGQDQLLASTWRLIILPFPDSAGAESEFSCIFLPHSSVYVLLTLTQLWRPLGVWLLSTALSWDCFCISLWLCSASCRKSFSLLSQPSLVLPHFSHLPVPHSHQYLFTTSMQQSSNSPCLPAAFCYLFPSYCTPEYEGNCLSERAHLIFVCELPGTAFIAAGDLLGNGCRYNGVYGALCPVG